MTFAEPKFSLDKCYKGNFDVGQNDVKQRYYYTKYVKLLDEYVKCYLLFMTVGNFFFLMGQELFSTNKQKS